MIDFAAFFTKFREIKDALNTTDAALGTTTQGAVDDLIVAYSPDDVEQMTALRNITAAARSFRTSPITSTLISLGRATLVSAVKSDAPQFGNSLDTAITEFLRQMRGVATVDASAVGATITPPDADAPTLMVSLLGPDGYALENLAAEDVVGSVSGSALLLSGEPAASPSRFAWDVGSGIRRILLVSRPSGGIVTNPSFDEDEIDDRPDNWNIVIGTAGTTIELTATETQTVAISGTPTSGHYVLGWTTAAGSVLATEPIAFDASGVEVAAAIQQLPGLAEVEVTTTGTAPNVTHTVAFSGVRPGGDQASLTQTNTFDVGAVTINTTQTGGPGTTWKALAIVGNGSQLTHLRQRVTLAALTQYAFAIQGLKDAGATGTVVIELTDGTGAVLTDEAGTNNRLTADVSTLSATDWEHRTAFFRTPRTLPEVVYLAIRLSVAVSNTDSIYLDDVILTPSREQYDGGPFVALAQHLRELEAEDRYLVVLTNDRAGEIQAQFGRIFNRAVLPSMTGGFESITDDGGAVTTTTTAP